MSVRVRFAPSPTGALHIGGVRTALYNYLFAKKNAGKFILRLEDTDQGRFVPGAEEYILEVLKWCGIEPEEGLGYGGHKGPYRQSERKEIYHHMAAQLIESGKAYYAFDTEAEIDLMRQRLSDQGNPAPKYDAAVRMTMRNSLTMSQQEVESLLDRQEPHVVRLLVEPDLLVRFEDIIREEVIFNTAELDDKVLIKGDGMPTYHMANVVDDHLMDITHVIRGEEWLSSTAHHLLLYDAFGWTAPTFAHLPLLMKPDGKGKLSKRDGAKFGIPVFPLSWITPEDHFIGFREFGIEPAALINFLAFLGWNPGTAQEIFSLEELAVAFDLHKVHKSGARFDIEKALWFNQQYIRQMPAVDIADRLWPAITAKGWAPDESGLYKVVELYRERVHKINEIVEQAAYLFERPGSVDSEAIQKHWRPEIKDKISLLTGAILSYGVFESQPLESFTKEKMKEIGLKPGEVFPLFRLGLCGNLQGPTVFEMLEFLGTEGVARINEMIENL